MITAILVLASIVNLICYIYVLICMFSEGRIIGGIVGLLCCQLWVFIWGWALWSNENKHLVMGIWTISILLGLALEGTTGTMSSRIEGY